MVPHGLLDADTKMTLLKWFKAYIYKPIKRRNLAQTIKLIVSESDAVELPVEIVPEEKTASETEEQKSRVDMETPPMIFVVEDHPINQELFAIFFSKMGYPSILANDGQDALEKMEYNSATRDAAIVFMDIQMPRMNGYDAARALRERGFSKPIIAITASALPDEKERCLKAGIDDVLVKPFKISGLQKMLGKWINAPSSHALQKTQLTNSSHQPVSDFVFDIEKLLETFMEDEQTLLPIITQFIERTQAQLEKIPELEKAGNWKSAGHEAHMIKGAALTMGGKELGNAASRLETAYIKMDRSEIQSAFPLLKQAFTHFKTEAESFVRARS
jgi:CheY-like chemotaxis protein/HPt (histidine-containing phosphotransfer) domain-containing protein